MYFYNSNSYQKQKENRDIVEKFDSIDIFSWEICETLRKIEYGKENAFNTYSNNDHQKYLMETNCLGLSELFVSSKNVN